MIAPMTKRTNVHGIPRAMYYIDVNYSGSPRKSAAPLRFHLFFFLHKRPNLIRSVRMSHSNLVSSFFGAWLRCTTRATLAILRRRFCSRYSYHEREQTPFSTYRDVLSFLFVTSIDRIRVNPREITSLASTTPRGQRSRISRDIHSCAPTK